MREIKFRVYDKNEKRMLNWDEIKIDIASYLNASDNEDIELMQYTGLHDCEGKEIYEGDIGAVSYISYKSIPEKRTVEIRYQEGEWLYCIGKRIGGSLSGFIHFANRITSSNKDTRIIIIGNICENPELLGKKCE